MEPKGLEAHALQLFLLICQIGLLRELHSALSTKMTVHTTQPTTTIKFGGNTGELHHVILQHCKFAAPDRWHTVHPRTVLPMGKEHINSNHQPGLE